MGEFNQKCYPIDDSVEIDGNVILGLWRDFIKQPHYVGFDGAQAVTCNKHPVLDLYLIRHREKYQGPLANTWARICGKGWEILFVHWRNGGNGHCGIEEIKLTRSTRGDDFDGEWPLAMLVGCHG